MPIISTMGSDTLMATLLLSIYELAARAHGITWELVDIVARTSLQLN